MLQNRNFKVSKGYILCYTLIIFSCLIILFLNIFKLIVLEYRNTRSFEHQLYSENLLENDRIYLINILSEKINSGIITVNMNESKESIREEIVNNCDAMRFVRGKSEIYYYEVSDEFILKTNINGLDSRYEIYNYEIIDNLIKLVYNGMTYKL